MRYMKYKCEVCGTAFDSFAMVNGGFFHEFGYQRVEEAVCPVCGADEQYCTEWSESEDDSGDQDEEP